MKVPANIPFRDRRAFQFAIAILLQACLLLLALPPLAHGQEFRATLTGQVTDPTGAVVPRAHIKAVNNDTGSAYTAETSDAGVYYIPYVVPGTYTVTATADGFKTAVQDKVLLLAGKYFGQNFTLQVGAANETVEVTGAPPLLETEDASGGTILDQKVLENVPVSGNQVYMLIGTTPGSQFTQTTFGPGGFSGTRGWDVTNQYIIGGGVNPSDSSGGFNQFTLNGTNITQQTSYGAMGAGTWNVSPNLDSVQEVNVMTTTYDARYGRTTGGTVNLVTKNGTNNFHGELFENYKDGSLFDANSTENVYISGSPTQQQVENQFGGTIGGPILKDKLWFFFSFEGYRQSIYNTVTASVPPEYLRPGFNGNSNVDFGLVSTMDPGFLSNGAQADPYVLYGLTLFQPGDSGNTSNPNNAQCVSGFNGSGNYTFSGPASGCGTAVNSIGFPNAYTGGTVNPLTSVPGSLVPAAQINNTALLMLQGGYVPLPNIKGAENYIGGFGEPSNYFAVAPDYYRYNQPMIRIDYNTSDKTKWYSFFEWQKGYEYRSTNGFTGLEANGNINWSRENWAASQDMTHTFSPTLLGDFKLSLSRFQVNYPDGNLGAAKPGSIIGLNITTPPVTTLKDVPEMNINGMPTLFGNSNDLEATTLVTLDVDFTKSKGPHNIHFGGGLGYSTYGNPINGSVANNANGAFAFSGQWTQFDPLNGNCYQPASLGFAAAAGSCSGAYAPNGSGWADFLLGLPGSGHVNWNDSLFDYQPIWNLYAQDDWKVTHRLTLNLGLRYDVQIGLKERYNELPRGFCETCVNPVTDDGVYKANIANAGNLAAWSAAGITVPTQVLGDIVPAGVNGQPRNAYDTDWKNVAPRIGFAFALDPKTVFRGGWGLMYGAGLEGGAPIGYQQTTNYVTSTDGGADPVQGGAAVGAASAGPYGTGTPFPASTAYPFGLLPPVGAQGVQLAGVGSGGLTVDNPKRLIPRTQVASFGAQRELPGKIVLDVRWAANYASRLRALLWDNGTISYPALQYALAPGSSVYSKLVPNPYYGVFSESFPGGCGQSPTIPVLALVLPYSQYCGFNSAPPVGEYNAPIGRNWYNGLETKLTKRTSHGLTFNIAYTYSKNINGDGYQNGYPYQDANQIHWLSSYDRTHVFTMTGVYDVPLGKGREFLSSAPKALDYAVGGWTLGWTFAAQTGTPVGLNQGYDYTCKSFAPPHGTSAAEWFNPLANTIVPSGETSCATAVPHIGGTGYTYNLTPNVTSQIRNPTIPDLDLSLQKNFKVTERVSFQLRGEAFNALNSALMGGPDTNPGDLPASLFYNQTTKRSYWTGFGTISPTQLNFPRNLRISGKIVF
ncbi:MAG TPA: TonB-dependent receptor [Verrucomicrobiae bacterium]|nr:TonB-dependent receptor [Verrucomicrobiae bacterium]